MTNKLLVFQSDFGLSDGSVRVEGKGNKNILVRLIGGIDNDTYDIKSSKKIKVYDYKNGNSVVRLWSAR